MSWKRTLLTSKIRGNIKNIIADFMNKKDSTDEIRKRDSTDAKSKLPKKENTTDSKRTLLTSKLTKKDCGRANKIKWLY